MPQPRTAPSATNFSLRITALAGVVLVCIVVAFHFPAIPQDPAYHHFADTRTIVGIPNFWNVVSNTLFLVFGVMGMRFVLRRRDSADPHSFISPVERWPYFIFFVGVLLTAFGSSYYHWNPNNHTLVWDRLPMTVGFMSLLAAMICERISVRAGIASLAPLLAFGIVSVEYWNVTESQGHGDLRLYALAQFGSLLVLLLMLTLFPPRYTRGADFMIALGFYALAKLLEVGDAAIYKAAHGLMSGHALKHIAAAFAAYWLLRMLERRVSLAPAMPPATTAKPV